MGKREGACNPYIPLLAVHPARLGPNPREAGAQQRPHPRAPCFRPPLARLPWEVVSLAKVEELAYNSFFLFSFLLFLHSSLNTAQPPDNRPPAPDCLSGLLWTACEATAHNRGVWLHTGNIKKEA